MDVDALGLDQLKDAFGIGQNGEGKAVEDVKVVKKADGTSYPISETAATMEKSKVTITAVGATTSAKFSVTINYKDNSGNEKSKDLTLDLKTNGTSANGVASELKDAISNDDELKELFTVGSSNADITFESKEAGAGKASITGISISTDSKNTISDKIEVTQKGADAYKSMDLSGIADGDQIVIGDKVYTKVAKLGKDSPENTFSNAKELQNLLEKDGLGVKDMVDNTGTDKGKKVSFYQLDDGYQVGDVSNEGKVYSDAVSNIDKALKTVTTQRSKLGANQNRLEHTINNLNLSSENLSAAKSRIEDTDMAKEMMNLTSANVLQQAATSMLAQANQAPNKITQLLG